MPPKSPVKTQPTVSAATTPSSPKKKAVPTQLKKKVATSASASAQEKNSKAPPKKNHLRSWEKSVRISSDSVLNKQREARRLKKKEAGGQVKAVLAKGKNRNALRVVTRYIKNTGNFISFKTACKIFQEHLDNRSVGRPQKRRMARVAHIILRSAMEQMVTDKFAKANRVAGTITNKPTVGKKNLQLVDFLSNDTWNYDLVKKNHIEYQKEEENKLKLEKEQEALRKEKREARAKLKELEQSNTEQNQNQQSQEAENDVMA